MLYKSNCYDNNRTKYKDEFYVIFSIYIEVIDDCIILIHASYDYPD